MRADELLVWAEERLKSSPALDHWQKGRELIEAEDLLMFVLDRDEIDPDDEVAPAQVRRFERLVERRFTGEPVPYIKGWAEFRGLRITARPGAFVPRDSSEFLAEQAVRRLRGRRDPVHVDLATGVGPVALAVANEVPGATVFGTDLSARAVALARANARRLGLPVRFIEGDLFAPVPASVAGRVDVITLHPPYVGRREVRLLPEEVRRFEPVESLTDRSPQGLGLIERAAGEAGDWLRRGGWLLVEVSPDRSRAVAALFRRAGFGEVRSTRGGLGVTRVVTGRKMRR
ncbi:MAG: peptide chain release factor N(5)-glutamine methyltransferase [Actinobacteria bacterium]|nr:peptide chain release factor N(5)-glutamine methyltransferase [Actinomycetota bacterium]